MGSGRPWNKTRDGVAISGLRPHKRRSSVSVRRHPPVWRGKDGVYRVDLDTEDRAVLRELPLQLSRALVSNPKGEAFRRLSPPAYASDPAAEDEYRRLVGQDLSDAKVAALETLAKTADAKELTEEELDAWLRALNFVRLWLGTVLDVSEDDDADEPEDPPHILYHALTWLQALVIDALSGEA